MKFFNKYCVKNLTSFKDMLYLLMMITKSDKLSYQKYEK